MRDETLVMGEDTVFLLELVGLLGHLYGRWDQIAWIDVGGCGLDFFWSGARCKLSFGY